MNIILEGPDNTGKSTLAQQLGSALGMTVILSGGREKHSGEINERVRSFLRVEQAIFDRHPAISQSIYSSIRSNTPVEIELVEQLYSSKPLIIYCRPTRGMDGHVVKEYDEASYVRDVEDKYDLLTTLYDSWALHHANFIYRIGDDVLRLIHSIKGAMDV